MGSIEENLDNLEEMQTSAFTRIFGDGMLSKAVIAAIILLVGLLLLKILLVLVRRTLRRSRLDDVLHVFVINTIKVVYLVILGITLLSSLGVPTSTFVTVIAACGAAVALALKDSLSNFAGGILILINKPFKQGDLIASNGVEGRVQHIDLLYSTLLTLNYQTITIPNGLVANNTIVNYSMAQRRRIDIKAGISYSADIETARQCIIEAVRKDAHFLQDPLPFVGVAEHGDSAVILDVQVWCETEKYFPARYALLELVKNTLDEAGIEIPFPQITIHEEKEDLF